ncbi:acyl-CoA dehydrogenase family protein [Pseudoroseomonas globiformis]|uniref:Acyl-CoA dehydrogenase family protein n=1 Tax=Teichococcus globiformis TaxID=2307229 RepID=A0ABV7FY32_9PROT
MSAALDDPDLAEAIRMLRDSAAGIAPREGDRRRIRALRFQSPGFDPAIWRQMGELGWIGLRLPEEQGGAGLGMQAFCALAEELGAALAPEPLVAGALSARVLAAAGAVAPLGRLLAGEALILTAWQERANSLDAPGAADAPRLFLPMADGAEAFILPQRATGGFDLYLQPAQGASLVLEPTQDGGSYGTLRAGNGQHVGSVSAAVLEEALDEAVLATAATLLGVADQAFALTLDYLRTRQQFGKPIGSFQALQHRAAELKVQLALTRASVEAAAVLCDRLGAPAAARRGAIARAKARAADTALLVTRQAVQLHGGIGYTDEADIGLYLRRAMVLANQFGSAALHRRRFATAQPEAES